MVREREGDWSESLWRGRLLAEQYAGLREGKECSLPENINETEKEDSLPENLQTIPAWKVRL